jgi:hypothetical protein
MAPFGCLIHRYRPKYFGCDEMQGRHSNGGATKPVNSRKRGRIGTVLDRSRSPARSWSYTHELSMSGQVVTIRRAPVARRDWYRRDWY